VGVEIRWVPSGPEDEQGSEKFSDHKGLQLPGDMKQSGWKAECRIVSSVIPPTVDLMSEIRVNIKHITREVVIHYRDKAVRRR